ncbi:MAG: PepSY-associated TM helix domain-containing protein [Bryobacterales bacterium]|nr:PepSY-associated TM helix domain-containing protein [Bryobacterales bacterium]MDE0295249.1 PepSY-associated TM helix domain-containing protein [Bryobacterales bacterium]
MSLRKAIFWVHLAVGVTAGVVILMLAVTGVILTYEAQLNRWALRDYRANPPGPGAAPLGLDELITRVTGGQPADAVTSVALHRDPLEPAVVELDGGATVFVDRFTGNRLGDGNTRTRRFLRSVMYWHRWFALEGEYRIIGRTVVAVANLGFLFLIVSGVYLWWPSIRSRATWRQALWFRRRLKGRARDFNWHSVIGFWSALPLAIIVFSGATISYQWAADLVHRMAGDTPPFQQSPRPRRSDARDNPSAAPEPTAPLVELQTLITRAGVETPGWRTLTIDLPDSIHDPVVVAADRGNGRQPSKSEDLLFDRATGELVERAGYPTFTPGFKIRRWLRFAHTGEVYGVVGQSIAGVVSLGVAVMVWTGLAMSWRRFFGS